MVENKGFVPDDGIDVGGKPPEKPNDKPDMEGSFPANVDITPGKIDHPIGENLGTTEEGKKADV